MGKDAEEEGLGIGGGTRKSDRPRSRRLVDIKASTQYIFSELCDPVNIVKASCILIICYNFERDYVD